jgi:hydrogenase expression/formation protein HypE
MSDPRDTITLAHGGGGRATRELIESVILKHFGRPDERGLQDHAELAFEGRLAFTTDSFVVQPLFFPGGDIGKLAVNGTVNDLSVSGAIPKVLSCGLIIEEGLSRVTLERVMESMATAATEAGVSIVTGDVKVVERGAADQLFINTAGIGVLRENVQIASWRAAVGDAILVSHYLGEHGAAIVDARGELSLEIPVESDCRPLNGLITAMLDACPHMHCLRDATRGGIATVLNEFAQDSGVGIRLEEQALPIREVVHGVCEVLGLDPLYLANEGTLIAVVSEAHAAAVLQAMRQHPAGAHAQRIGTVTEKPKGRVLLQTSFGGERVVDVLYGEQLPRIC